MSSFSGYLATVASRTVVAFVIAGLMLHPAAVEANADRPIEPPAPEPPAIENIKRIQLKPPAIDSNIPTPDTSKIRDSVNSLLDRLHIPNGGDGEPPSEGDGGFGILSGGSPFGFTYERLSHAGAPRLGPDANTGAFQYSLPIVTPPGRNGLEPKLELLYSSSAIKNEYLGLGWTTNIPYIERINRTGAEDLYTGNYFFSSLDGELRPATSSREEMSMGGGGFQLNEGAPLFQEKQLAALSESSPGASATIDQMLEGKTATERANIKADGITKRVPMGEYDDATYGLHVEIQDIEKIEGGVQIFARAWKGGDQVGFGPDGSVEIERFRIFNPPVLVDDPNGEIVREWTDPETGETRQRKLREDPVEATRQGLAHTISIVGKTGKAITRGKSGKTTSTFYPQGGSGGGNTTFDAYYNWGGSGSFASARDQSGSSGVWSGGGTTRQGTSCFSATLTPAALLRASTEASGHLISTPLEAIRSAAPRSPSMA